MKIPLKLTSLQFLKALLLFGIMFSLTAPAPAANTVSQWGIYQINLHGPSSGNPFVDVHLSATFDNGFKQVKVAGFYDGNGIYRIRFMPDKQGQWHYETHANVRSLTHKEGSFTVIPPGKENHGPVRVYDTHHFAYADGTRFIPIGTTIYDWLDAPESVQKETLKTLAHSPFNKVRFLVTEQPDRQQKTNAPWLWPFAGTPPHDWDFNRFNPAFFRHFEKRLGQLRDLGIQADLILFNPYGHFGFNSMTPAQDDRFIRYLVARFGAYRNVWWCLANESSFIHTKTVADWNRLGTLLEHCDPYQHLRSIHNGPIPYDYSKPWVTHVSFQSRVAVESPGSAGILRQIYQKPIIYDEVGYEGNISARWGDLSAQQMVHRFWCGTIAGCYVTHGDTFSRKNIPAWTSYGGIISGHSVPRIAFLKKIIEEAPPLNPIDPDYQLNVAGQPGKYYLIYFGHKAPTNWTFKLYKHGLTNGMTFKVDIIDTWNMTITPVPGKFVTKKKNRYYFVDAQGRSVSLPGRPYMALRIQYVGNQTAAKSSDK